MTAAGTYPSLRQSVTVVTGAASGIGAAIARALVDQGALTWLTDRDADGLDRLASELSTTGRAPAGLRTLDVTSEEAVEERVREIQHEAGPIDVLVNNAGVSTMAPFVALTTQEWDMNLGVNAKGVFLVTRAVLPGMLERGSGVIVNVASAAAKRGVPYLAHYAASKHAVLGLTKSVALEAAGRGVRVNAVCPGFVATPMQDREVIWEGRLRGLPPEEVRREYVAMTPLGRLCEPDDVADVVLFLASSASRFMTGQALNVTGGLLM